MTTVVGVRFKKLGHMYYFDPHGLAIAKDSPVIVETQRGLEYGQCVAAPFEVEDEKIVPPLRKVVRMATDEDEAAVSRNRIREREAVEVFNRKVREHKLIMKFVDVEYSFDGSKIIFFFTADGRVDFRELVKDLAGLFRTRIELRQIGVRDEAKILGGLGICGRPFCCASFLDDFQPVSIKMAKEQSLSLNPTKISGTCGRLMCCLKYEQDAYEDLLANTPRVEAVVKTPDGDGVVTDVSLLRGNLKVRLESAPDSVRVYHKGDVTQLKGGSKNKTIKPRRRVPGENAAPGDAAPAAPVAAPAAQPARFEIKKSAHPRPERPERSERPERPERSERPERPSPPERKPSGGGENAPGGDAHNIDTTAKRGSRPRPRSGQRPRRREDGTPPEGGTKA